MSSSSTEPGSPAPEPAAPASDEGAALSPPVSPEAARRFRRTRWLVLVLVVLVIAGLDQWSKHWADQSLRLNHGGRITVLDDYFAFSYVRNPGAAWGFLARADERFRQPFFVGVSVLAMVFIFFLHRRLEPGQYWTLAALSLVMGGAVGNFIDRLRFRYVIDFIELHFRHRYRWPTFNVADIAITAGVLLLFLEMFLGPWLRRRRARESQSVV